jgi:hypothetical protein
MYLLFINTFVLAAVFASCYNKAFCYYGCDHLRAEEEREELQTEMDELSAARPQKGAHLQAGRGPHCILAETLRKQVIHKFVFIHSDILSQSLISGICTVGDVYFIRSMHLPPVTCMNHI